MSVHFLVHVLVVVVVVARLLVVRARIAVLLVYRGSVVAVVLLLWVRIVVRDGLAPARCDFLGRGLV